MQDINDSELVSIDGGELKLPGWVGVIAAVYDWASGFVGGLKDESIPYVSSSIRYEYVESTITYM